jgi:hypothetical protein
MFVVHRAGLLAVTLLTASGFAPVTLTSAAPPRGVVASFEGR